MAKTRWIPKAERTPEGQNGLGAARSFQSEISRTSISKTTIAVARAAAMKNWSFR